MGQLSGTLKIFWELVKDELRNARLLDVVAGIAGFVVSALFWWFLFGGKR